MNTSKNISAESASKIRTFRRETHTTDRLTNGILEGNKTALSRAITLIESTNSAHTKQANEIIERCLTHKTKSIRIGITGVPGVGKSTFIESFGKRLTTEGHKVAVLAVDPTSTVTRGSILGDKTRMEELVKDTNAFIRPSPSGSSLGGVARKTRETIVLCEAAGYNIILIETVGVGQSETAVHSMVDFFLLLKLAGAGDELQGIKRGIMEMADAIVINKSDGDNIQRAKKARVEFARALHLLKTQDNGWIPKVLACSALEDTGITEVWGTIKGYVDSNTKNSFFNTKRQEQNKYWLLQTIEDQLKQQFYQDKKVKEQLQESIDAVVNNKTSPFAAADKLLKLHSK
ncbi:methylmalonyl Co-A mutase-associated GTPase MeaB [Cellulophaga sp. 20_2_10]|uniref:methylmalonyl Co-A mutase-associated GTPase MeaB n=1 Tax=Cellulophaga sp. 20_2_10 TaxID=2942476 RepID=UPI00201B32E7|nr:methylmalonyl Co-A mutase-associated GTPase MeaB [Cellulophaga sp. 20_2_10]MCL5245916.1 methylmalonyl Co-A mutase-associated GTPase MeaB [Cellulophaga sp. 20_2_10]